MEIHGMLNLEDLKKLVDTGEIETVMTVFTDHYGRMMGKRLDTDFFFEKVAEHSVGACNYLLTVDMDMDTMQGYQFANWETGYGDFHLKPDLETLRVASWLDKTAMVLCDVYLDEACTRLVEQAPRSILKAQLAKAAETGFDVMAATELEYFLFEDTYREAAENDYSDLTSVSSYAEDYHMLQASREEFFNARARKALKHSGIPVENSKGEWGKGQHELNVCYAEALTMADRHCVFKQCFKELADQLQCSVTFMAKPETDGAGSSCHMHLSLWKDGQNAFAGDKTLADIQCSDVFRHFLAGWIKHMPELMVFYAPTINSYKRFQDSSWAPTSLAWSRDNRTAGFRIVGEGESLRIECRIPGADCNPYLAIAAAIASGMDGVKNSLEPPEAKSGNMYAAEGIAQLPKTLSDAVNLFKQSDFARSAFGEVVVEHYAHFYRLEVESYDKAVTDWERRRYFEQI